MKKKKEEYREDWDGEVNGADEYGPDETGQFEDGDGLDTEWYEESRDVSDVRPRGGRGGYKEQKPEDNGKFRVMTAIITISVCVIIAAVVAILVLRATDNGGEEADKNGGMTSAQTSGTAAEPSVDSSIVPSVEPSAEPSSSPETLPSSAAPSEPAGNAGTSGEGTVSMSFEAVEETVTAKQLTNLRTVPDMTSDDTVAVQLKNGETAKRVGINKETGWSKLEYNGQTLYAVSQYLTTDMKTADNTDKTKPSDTPSDKAPAASGNTVTTKDGKTVTFQDADDYVSPKMEVNMRLEPSTAQGNDTIHGRLAYGESVHRTGISEDSGWSRVEYDGKTLYVISSYVFADDTQNE